MELRSIAQIVAVAPEIGVILREAEQESARRSEIPFLYGRYRARLTRLVGWRSPCQELQSERAYMTAIKALCDALDC